jgi:hypothetical protein
MKLNAGSRRHFMAYELLHRNAPNERVASLPFTNVIDHQFVNDVFSADPPGNGISSLKKTIMMMPMKKRRQYRSSPCFSGMLLDHDVDSVDA